MSFKLVGDQFSGQEAIRRRRVEELFSVGIHKDEALLMKNGRYCCLVCSHRPIFDTIPVLALHRQGKKHMTCANRKLVADIEKMDEVKKRMQVGSSKDAESLAPLLQQVKQATSKVLTSSKPYSAIVSRKRKPIQVDPSEMSLPPSKSCDSQVVITPDKDIPPVVIEDYELVQPWNAGYSRCKSSSLGGRKLKKMTGKEEEKVNSSLLVEERSGWKRGRNGEWIKDPSAEFDSDSEHSEPG